MVIPPVDNDPIIIFKFYDMMVIFYKQKLFGAVLL